MKTAQSPVLYSEYLTPEQAADVLGVHVQTVRGYVRSGKLPASRLAGSERFAFGGQIWNAQKGTR
jgi:excisionase family DNA binding protein